MSLSQEAGGHDVVPREVEARVLNSENSGGLGGGGEKKAVESGSTLTEAASIAAQKRLRNGSPKGKEVIAVGGGGCEQEGHIWIERERRTKMKNMFRTLHALLPQLPLKANKETIVEAAIKAIKELEATLNELQKDKLERIQGTVPRSPLPTMATAHRWQATSDLYLAGNSSSSSSSSFPLCFQTWSSPEVVLSVTGADAHINICAATKPGLLFAILYSLDKYKLDILSLHVSCDCFRSMFMIHAKANGTPDSFREALPLAEIFKSAVEEIMSWIS